MKILCFSEDIGWFRQFITVINKFGGDAYAVTTKSNVANELIKLFDKVYVCELGVFNPEIHSKFIYYVINQVNPDIFITSSTNKGRMITGMIAGLWGVKCVSDVVDIDAENNKIILTRLVYGGSAKAMIEVNFPVAICVSPGAFPEGSRDVRGELVKVDFYLESKVHVDFKPRVITDNEPDKADIVVVAGRGIRSKEDLNMIIELARLLGGAWSVTRPLAADYGWTDTWIGMSGLTITPKLYIGVGVSGQPHHIIGARGSKIIIAVNKDSEAPIFEESDYGIVGDLYKVIPLLIKKLKGEV